MSSRLDIPMNSQMWIEAMQQETGLRTSPRLSVDDRIDSLMRNYCIQIGHPASEEEVLALAALVLLRYSQEDPAPLEQLRSFDNQAQQDVQMQQPTHTYNLRPRN
jgi:hypothetical protein